MHNEALRIMEFVKSTKLKGEIEIRNEYAFTWNLGGLFLHFCIDDEETLVLYSTHKSGHCEIGHFHEDTCNIINLIQNISNEDKRVHIVAFIVSYFNLGSSFCLEDKTKKKKKSWLLIRHYYSEF